MAARHAGRLARLIRPVATLAAAAAIIVAGTLVVPGPRTWTLGAAAQADEGHGSEGGDGGDRGGGDSSGSGGNEDKGAQHEDAHAEDAGSVVETGGERSEDHDFVPDEVVIANLSDRAKTDVRQLGFVVLDEQRLAALGLTVTRLRVPRQLTAASARNLLAARFPGVVIDLNVLYRPQAQLVLPAPDYGARLIGWGRVAATCGERLRLGAIDTGIDTGIGALRAARIVQRSFLPPNSKPAPTDHGTAVAAILVARDDTGNGPQGLLPGAELAVANVMGIGANGAPAADVLALIQGLDWLVGRSTRVINMSLTGNANALVAIAVRQSIARGTILVAAVGNGGPGAPPEFPAAEPGVIGVTAVDSQSQPYAHANQGDYVSFAAPGVRIWTPTATGAGRYSTGTSFAAPFVAAAAAAALATGAPADAAGVTAALAKTAIDLGAPGKDSVFGWGLVHAAPPCPPVSQ